MGLANIAAINMEHLCECDAHGYSQEERWGRSSLGTCEVYCEGHTSHFYRGDRDCSSAVCDAWQEALIGTEYEGVLSDASYTGNMRSVFVNSGLFEWKPMSFIAQRGDIYLKEGAHTAMCISAYPDLLGEFSISENGTIYGQSGDQTGRESRVHDYYDYPWDGILHYVGPDGGGSYEPEPQPTPSPTGEVSYRVSVDSAGRSWYSELSGYNSNEGDGYAGDFGTPIRWLAMNFDGWYQVRTEANGWLPQVSNYNINDLDYGCAGDGSPILAIRCYLNTTGHYIEYAAHVMGAGWLDNMKDLTDTGGSSDDYAGDGSYIDGFRARII